MTAVDIIILLVVGISVLVALFRGAVREILTLGAWIGSVIATPLIFPFVKDLARSVIGYEIIADVLTLAVIFGLLLSLLTFLCHRLSAIVRDSALSPLDRTLGVLFGFVRGMVVLCAIYLIASYATGGRSAHYDWVKESSLVPIVAEVSDYFAKMLTEESPEFIPAFQTTTEIDFRRSSEYDGRSQLVEGLERPSPPPQELEQSPPSSEEEDSRAAPEEEPSEQVGYSEQERQRLDRLFETAN